ncbi:MAG: isochorismatase family protein [Rhodospirillales bacterium]|jgi:nicotinamidase-related amidase|nr:isochorismatase family protein [Rhodospirillales bacterium]
MTKSRLLIVHVQRGFVNDKTRHVPDRVAALQESFDAVIITRFYNPQKSLHRKLIGEAGFAVGAAAGQLAFTPRADARICDVPTYGVDTPFIEELRTDTAPRVHLCGIATETAVLAAAIALFSAGIEPVVLGHACGSDQSLALHDAALQILKRAIGARQVIGS